MREKDKIYQYRQITVGQSAEGVQNGNVQKFLFWILSISWSYHDCIRNLSFSSL